MWNHFVNKSRSNKSVFNQVQNNQYRPSYQFILRTLDSAGTFIGKTLIFYVPEYPVKKVPAVIPKIAGSEDALLVMNILNIAWA